MSDPRPKTAAFPAIQWISSPSWKDYELLDSGNGAKLERYGPYRLVRPEAEAIWRPAMAEKEWDSAHARFVPAPEENGGNWQVLRPMDERWKMEYRDLRFWAQISGSRHLGVFPEQACQWDWTVEQISAASRPVKVLNLFGYTGLASLAAAQAGAKVTHVDASRKVIGWARENQSLSGLEDRPIRWILEDALKFIRREARRGAQYDGLILDPPKFGRGPKGEVWEFYKLLPSLLDDCRALLSPNPIFIVLTAYAVKASALTLYFGVEEMMQGYGGDVTAGELTLVEKSAGRILSLAIFARWAAMPADKS
ncbi:MAG TPA: class I SAM-dependent methyltransferase [Anaerolineaceae bacterium]|nr:class I SAM-dependent methyltransferase [Anaerolineaceae bacterium]